MIKINLSPVRDDDKRLSVAVQSPIITVNEFDYDLSLIGDGDTVDHPVIQNCTRTGDDYELTLIFYHGYTAPMESRFPAPIDVTIDGPVTLPLYDLEVAQ